MSRKGSLTRKNRETQTLTHDNRVVLYVRASTPEQVNSLDAQKASATRFCAIHNLDVDQVFIDSGVSAVKSGIRDRPQAAAMFRHMKLRAIRTVLILRVDRAFRSSLDFSQTLAWARDNGVNFRFIDPDIDLGTPMGEMFIQIQVALAQMECGIRSARVDDALESLRDHRLSRNGSQAPYGWQATPCGDGTKTRLGTDQFRHTPIPAEQAVLRHLLELWEIHQGHGALTHIANLINDLGIPTKMPAGTIFTRTYKKGTPQEFTRTFTATGQWQPATVKSVLEHAILATDAELLDGIPSLEQAAASLQKPESRPQNQEPKAHHPATSLLILES